MNPSRSHVEQSETELLGFGVDVLVRGLTGMTPGHR